MRIFGAQWRLGLLVSGVSLAMFFGSAPGVGAARLDQERLREHIGGLRIPFIANRGQTDSAVAYYAPTFAGTVYVTRKGEIVYSLPHAAGGGWSLTETVVGGKASPVAYRAAEAQVSYFLGNDPARWRSGLPTYDSVSLGEVWDGITVSLEAHGDNVEKLFTVNPGVSARAIRLRIKGAKALRLDKAGRLVAATGPGEIVFSAPVAYQEREGRRLPVAVAYALSGDEYGFRLGKHDTTRPVVIDPILQSTYLGGSGSDSGLALAIHPTSGEVYVAGETSSSNFPGTTGGLQPAFGGGGSDAFVARLNATLTTLSQATYLGGSGSDFGLALAIHPTSGEVLVAGQTFSTNFPGTTGGAQPAFGGAGSDAFVARLNATLTTLSQATYLGGSGSDDGRALAIHPTSGEVFVAGRTDSTNFPGTTGGAQPASGGGQDAFVARLNVTLTTLSQATYLGGGGTDLGFALAIHPTSGEVFVAGQTDSANFPGTTGGAQPASGGGFDDAFVARLNATLTTLSQATYLGGSGGDFGRALAIHPTSGEVYVAGLTLSTNFPVTTGGAQPASGGGSDAFVARLTADLAGGGGPTPTPTPTVTPTPTPTVTGPTATPTLTPTTVPGTADLSVTKTDSPDPATVGGTLTYTVVVTNNGPATATNVTLTDTLPSGVTFQSASSTQGSCAQSSGIVTCSIGTLANGASATATIQVSPQASGNLINTVLASATQADPSPANSSSTANTTVGPGGAPVEVPTLSLPMLVLLGLALAGIALFVLTKRA